MLDLWYKNAVIYSRNVATFMDANGDGVGDFQGLTNRLDYIAKLGVTCLWLLPFFPSPRLDYGYDVTDYYNVAPDLGTLGDFVEFSHQARLRGLRLMMDLPINHTSDQNHGSSRRGRIRIQLIANTTCGRRPSRRTPMRG